MIQRVLIALNLALCLAVVTMASSHAFFEYQAPVLKVLVPVRSKPKLKLIKVAVIDTGLDPALMNKDWVCDSGHKDFTDTGLKDTHGHGTHISGIIDQYAKDYIFDRIMREGKSPSDIDDIDVAYCQIIIKYYDPKKTSGDNLANTINAFNWAISQHVDIINYSGGGEEPSLSEKQVVLKALNSGIKIVAAAGNENHDIDKHPYYPAMYDNRIYRVGSLTREGIRSLLSNYGDSVTYWEVGYEVYSRLPNGYGNMSGTSQATAVKSGKLVREMLLRK